jgi:recombination protein RecR
MHLLRSPKERISSLGDAVSKLTANVVFCETCWNIAEENPCRICCEESRDKSIICVVEEILDVVAIEKTGEYKGLYHVLHGALSPVDGIGPDQLKIVSLVERMTPEVKEIILATNPSLEGEATALYIQKQLRGFDAKITRIARGLPVGGDVEYADEITLIRAMNGRGDF